MVKKKKKLSNVESERFEKIELGKKKPRGYIIFLSVRFLIHTLILFTECETNKVISAWSTWRRAILASREKKYPGLVISLASIFFCR